MSLADQYTRTRGDHGLPVTPPEPDAVRAVKSAIARVSKLDTLGTSGDPGERHVWVLLDEVLDVLRDEYRKADPREEERVRLKARLAELGEP